MIIIVRHPLNLSNRPQMAHLRLFRLCLRNGPCRVHSIPLQKVFTKKITDNFVLFWLHEAGRFPRLEKTFCRTVAIGESTSQKYSYKSIWNRVQDWLSFLLRHAVTFCPPTFFGAELIGWAVSSGGESPVVFSEGGEGRLPPPWDQSPIRASSFPISRTGPKKTLPTPSHPSSLFYFLFPLWIVFLWENKCCCRLLGRLRAKEMGCGVCVVVGEGGAVMFLSENYSPTYLIDDKTPRAWLGLNHFQWNWPACGHAYFCKWTLRFFGQSVQDKCSLLKRA